jgi:hypothetical protein
MRLLTGSSAVTAKHSNSHYGYGGRLEQQSSGGHAPRDRGK